MQICVPLPNITTKTISLITTALDKLKYLLYFTLPGNFQNNLLGRLKFIFTYYKLISLARNMKAENMHFHITLLWYKKLSVIIRQPLIPVPLSLALI